MAGAADLGGGIGGGIGATIAYFLEQGDRDKAMDLLKQAESAYGGLPGGITAQEVGPSALNSISLDPNDRGTQLEVLQRLKDVYSKGGLDAQARADQYESMQSANQNAQAQEANVRNQMAARGLASSGSNYAAQRAAAQNAANQTYASNLRAAAAGEQRATGALQGAGQMAGNLYAQDYGVAANRANANDAVSRFNASQRQNAAQQTFDNEYAKANGSARALGAESEAYRRKSDDGIKAGQGIGGTVGTAAGIAANGGF